MVCLPPCSPAMSSGTSKKESGPFPFWGSGLGRGDVLVGISHLRTLDLERGGRCGTASLLTGVPAKARLTSNTHVHRFANRESDALKLRCVLSQLRSDCAHLGQTTSTVSLVIIILRNEIRAREVPRYRTAWVPLHCRESNAPRRT